MLLAIDTSGVQTSVVISKNDLHNSGDLVFCQSGDSHSSSLFNLVERALSQSKTAIKDLSAIIIGSGPGSFTGLRIGYAFVKGMAVADNIPLVAISSLSAVAWQFRDKSKAVLAIDDARRGEYFAAAYSYVDDVWAQTLKDQILDKAGIEAWLHTNPHALLVTANAEMLRDWPKISLAADLAVALVSQALCTNLLVKQATERPELSAQIAELSPVYIRKVAAMTIEERTTKTGQSS